jgi:hypothetical protein
MRSIIIYNDQFEQFFDEMRPDLTGSLLYTKTSSQHNTYNDWLRDCFVEGLKRKYNYIEWFEDGSLYGCSKGNVYLYIIALGSLKFDEVCDSGRYAID